MANGTHPTNLIVQPKPQVTRYNRVALWGAIGVVVLVALTYSLVIRDHGRRSVEPRRARLTSLPQPLVTELPKAQPPPPAPPPKEQPVTWHPEPPPPPAPAPQQDPLTALRRKERQDAYRSPILVAAFTPERAPAQANGGQANGHVPTPPPQVLEIEPAQQDPWREEFPQPSRFGDVSGTAPQYLTAQLQPPRSPYQINAGMLLPVVLAQDVTSDVASFCSAIVTRDVYDSVTGRYLLVPLGSRIVFLSNLDDQTNQQPILLLSAKTLYLPNGYSIALQGMPAATGFGMTGLQDQVNRHFVQRYGSAAVLSLVTAGIRMATYARRGGGFYYAPEDAAINGAGSVMGRTIAEDLRRSLTIRPTVVIRAGYPFTVTVTQDMVFPGPYAAHPHVAQHEEEMR